jgi:hypothetical protein
VAKKRRGSMKRIIAKIVFIVLLASSPSFAGIYDLELNASRSYLEARYSATLPLEKSIVSTGLGAIYRDDEYKLADIKLTMGKQGLFVPELRLDIGLAAVAGDVERDRKEGDLMAVGLLVSANYPIPEILSPIPIRVSAALSFAQEPFCFWDSERYFGLRTSLGFRVTDNGEIILGYNYIRARLDDNRGQWKVSDATIFIGYRISY